MSAGELVASNSVVTTRTWLAFAPMLTTVVSSAEGHDGISLVCSLDTAVLNQSSASVSFKFPHLQLSFSFFILLK